MADKNCFEPNGDRITVKYLFECLGQYADDQDEKRNESEKRIIDSTSELVHQVGKRIDDSKKDIKENADDIKDHKENDKNWRIGLGATVLVICVFYPAAFAYISGIVSKFV